MNYSAKYIIFNEIKNKIFLDALSKSDARLDGKQEIFLIWPKKSSLEWLFHPFIVYSLEYMNNQTFEKSYFQELLLNKALQLKGRET